MKSLYYVVLALGLAGCSDGPCTTPPCALGLALSLTIQASGGGSAPMTTVAVSGAEAGTLSCAATCSIAGEPGTYVLDVSAPGFVSVHRTVEVGGTTSKCGCGTVQTASVTIDLVPM